MKRGCIEFYMSKKGGYAMQRTMSIYLFNFLYLYAHKYIETREFLFLFFFDIILEPNRILKLKLNV